MNWLRRSRTASYAVDGVEPWRSSGGWDIFDGDALAWLPAVAEAAARLPQDPAMEDLPD
ncbi:hypothetical protein OG470_19865 [Micromonospora sp. NBC_00389]|uniref:hypothetical protein n=1 Tax=Micromonospora sp. NBC_00389 TaxID=2903586 RepID=UPI002E1FFD61